MLLTTIIESNYFILNTFWGAFRHENIGEMHFNDTTNGLKADFKLGDRDEEFCIDWRSRIYCAATHKGNSRYWQ